MIIDPRNFLPLRSKGAPSPSSDGTSKPGQAAPTSQTGSKLTPEASNQISTARNLTTEQPTVNKSPAAPGRPLMDPLQAAINSLKQQRTSIIDATQLKSNQVLTKTVDAVIDSSQRISPDQAKQWLAEFKNLPSDIKHLLAQPRVFLATLSTGQQVIINTPLEAGKTSLNVMLTTVHSKDAANTNKAPVLLTQITQPQKSDHRLPQEGLRGTSTSSGNNTRPMGSGADSLLSQALLTKAYRTLLPTLSPRTLPQTFNHLEKFTQLPQNLLNKYQSSGEQRLTRAILSLAKTPQELNTPSSVKQSIQNSGVFLERRTQYPLNEYSALKPTTGFQPLHNLRINDFLQRILERISPLLTNKNSPASTPESSPAGRIPPAEAQLAKLDVGSTIGKSETNIKEDLKALLLALTATMNSPGITTALSTTTATSANSSVDQLLKQILFSKQFTSKNNARNGDNTTDKLRSQLHQQLNTAIAKILLNQLQSLNTRTTATNEGNTPAPVNLQLEIPIRLHEQFYSLQLFIEDEWIEKDRESTEESEKKRQWNVMLCFDLPENQTLYAQVRCLENNANIRFWTQHKDLLKTAKDNLVELKEQLQKHGITVNDIQCIAGAPPLKKNQLDYSLIDVKT